MIEELPVFASSERNNKTAQVFDEKHYFVIPFELSEVGFTLHTMRCLPKETPEVNDLPKRRIFTSPMNIMKAACVNSWWSLPWNFHLSIKKSTEILKPSSPMILTL
ncbi:hypothetical protein P3339_02525 [Microbulbifer sp. MLAF003]|uniref:hypothetical protein n=1 Tax=unclassified Microbulbifer TaxID=2619833 RepID=UPI0024AE5959|nr:hypothetical protein [Microbulbifer sp. MLAF003]WHI51728.1 hypothetical protein P3339_02525 [Microbulbifer sp. MLAF003]